MTVPPFRAEPLEAEKKETKERNIHVEKKIPCLAQKLRKGESKKKKI